MKIGLDAMTEISPAGDSRAGEVLRLRREISRMQRRRSEHPLLPLDPAFSSLLPEQGLQTGTAYTVSPSPGLVLALLSAASGAGLWCAVVGMPTLGIEAAAAFGVELPRLILVPEPGDRWLAATSALAEVVPLIAVRPGGRVRDAEMSRLGARLRDRGSTLLVVESDLFGVWPQSEGTIRLHDQHWEGIGEGWGLIEGSTATVTARTRHDFLATSVRVRLPGSNGAVERLTAESVVETVAAPMALTGLRAGADPDAREHPLAVAG